MKNKLGELNILDKDEGHKKYEWSLGKSLEIKKVRKIFDEKVRAGWMAYRITGPHAGEIIRQFDENAEAIIMRPPQAGG